MRVSNIRHLFPGTVILAAAALMLTGCSEVSGPIEIRTSTSGNGAVQPQSVRIAQGQTAAFSIEPRSGYVVDEVQGCRGTLQGRLYITGKVRSSCVIEASFRRPRISGRIITAAHTDTDNTINNPAAPVTANDSFGTAQPISSAATVAGYVNRQEAGPDGRSRTAGDIEDYYVAELAGGQQILLEVANPGPDNDLDLLLFNADQELVDASLGVEVAFERVLVPLDAPGDYYVVVRAVSGASGYTLSLGQSFSNVATAESGWRLGDDFLAHEAVVKMAETTPASSPLRQQLSNDQRALRIGRPTDERNRRYRFRDAEDALASAINERARRALDQSQAPERLRFARAEDADKYETLRAIKALQQHDDVESAQPNYLYELHSFRPNDPFFDRQWHYEQIRLPHAWPDASGEGVTIAVLDTGVALEHPDLESQLLPGFDFLFDTAGGDDPGMSSPPPGGSSFHGTHVAGTIAAATNNDTGVAGVAFNARILPVRVCVDIFCSGYAIEQGLRYAAGMENDSGGIPDQPADIINLSLGRVGGPNAAEQALYDELRELGITVVASAGNRNSSTWTFPAAYQNVFAVGAVDAFEQRAFYSNFGDWVDLVAPGGDLRIDSTGSGVGDGILSTTIDDRSGSRIPAYRYMQGTSMSAPHVSGVFALMKSVTSGLGPQDIELMLRQDQLTDDLGMPGQDVIFGHGLINAEKAVNSALSFDPTAAPQSPMLSVEPGLVNFGASGSVQQVRLSNAGGGELALETPTENSSGWLTLEPGDSPYDWTLSVDRDGLPDGPYQATVRFPSDVNTVSVDVQMQVGTSEAADAGLLYVLLLDPDTLETRYQVIAEAEGNGDYLFSFDGVEPAEYLIAAGSDLNNNLQICGLGEVCGLFPQSRQPQSIRAAGRDTTNVTFNVSVQATFDGVPSQVQPLARF